MVYQAMMERRVVCRGSGMLLLNEEGEVDTALPIDVTFVEYVCIGPGSHGIQLSSFHHSLIYHKYDP
jgi:hypothetical protein